MQKVSKIFEKLVFINRKDDIDYLWNHFSTLLLDGFKELIIILSP